MDLPRRPSSQPPRSLGLDRAQGTFREALAALRNLSNLVRSRKVGPRAILDMVPDVRSACQPLSQAGEDVFAVIEQYVDAAAVASLKAFLLERSELLAKELGAAEEGTMSARQRLRLEQTLDELWRDLNGSRALLSMLESSVYEQDLPSDLVELMLQTYSGPPSAGQVYALIPAHISSDGVEVLISQPRTVAALLACGSELVSSRDSGSPQIEIGTSDGVWTARLTVSAQPKGVPLTIWGYGAVPPALPCLRAVAERVGLATSWDADAWTLIVQAKT